MLDTVLGTDDALLRDYENLITVNANLSNRVANMRDEIYRNEMTPNITGQQFYDAMTEFVIYLL